MEEGYWTASQVILISQTSTLFWKKYKREWYKVTHIIAVNQISKTASTSPYSIYNVKQPLIYPPFGISKSIQSLNSLFNNYISFLREPQKNKTEYK